LTSLERDNDPPGNTVMTLWESRVRNKTEPIGCFGFEFFVDAFSDARVVPTPWAVYTAGNDLTYADIRIDPTNRFWTQTLQAENND
jgi:hypothetical protein